MADDSSATTFAGLDTTFPDGAVDTMDVVDDQLQMLKTVLTTHFANFASTPVTATEAEINTLDGFTGAVADLNIIAGGAAAGVSAAEFQYLNGVTSAIQTQLSAKAAKGANNDITSLSGLTTDLTVAQGGTGRGTATAYAVIVGGTTSTGAHQSVASVGTSGQVLTSNGAGAKPTFQSPALIAWARYNSAGTLLAGGGALSTGNASLSGNRFTVTFNTARASATGYGVTASVNAVSDPGNVQLGAFVDSQTTTTFIVETSQVSSGYSSTAYGFTVAVYE